MNASVSGFGPAERVWLARLGNLRNVVRQEVIARQLADHVTPGMRVLDVGCGQGTQILRLAGTGCRGVGVDPSAALLARLRKDADEAQVRIETYVGSLEQMPAHLTDRTFDLVCAHGLVMYLEDTEGALRTLSARVAHGGALSITFRNASALAFRPAMRGRWSDALEALEARTYVNELGVPAVAHTIEQMGSDLTALGFGIEAWYGVRVFTDPLSNEQAPPGEPELRRLLAAEYEAGRRDPYRHFGSQLHVLARRRS